jgi:hypothetical protein
VPHIIREISPRLTEEQPVDTPTKNDATHTPGPWTFEYRRLDKSIDLGLQGDGVCRVNNDDIDHREALANANLISAAPDLLAACKAFYHGTKTDRECEAMMGAAIRKAEGGAQ